MADIRDTQRMADIIAERFRPERIILFGSHARGDAAADSDVDLLVVMDTDAPITKRALPIRKALWDFPMPKDILVRTPREFEEAKSRFWTVTSPAAREGRVLYERKG
jgi:predicted nucleotidyltransferase